MYDIFLKLLEKNGVTAYKVGKETGIAASTFSDWKSGRSVPKQEKLQKIADFFNVSLEYLMTGKDNRFSDEAAKLNAKILFDVDLQTHIKKLDLLCGEDKKSVYDMIDFLYSKAQK